MPLCNPFEVYGGTLPALLDWLATSDRTMQTGYLLSLTCRDARVHIWIQKAWFALRLRKRAALKSWVALHEGEEDIDEDAWMVHGRLPFWRVESTDDYNRALAFFSCPRRWYNEDVHCVAVDAAGKRRGATRAERKRRDCLASQTERQIRPAEYVRMALDGNDSVFAKGHSTSVGIGFSSGELALAVEHVSDIPLQSQGDRSFEAITGAASSDPRFFYSGLLRVSPLVEEYLSTGDNHNDNNIDDRYALAGFALGVPRFQSRKRRIEAIRPMNSKARRQKDCKNSALQRTSVQNDNNTEEQEQEQELDGNYADSVNIEGGGDGTNDEEENEDDKIAGTTLYESIVVTTTSDQFCSAHARSIATHDDPQSWLHRHMSTTCCWMWKVFDGIGADLYEFTRLDPREWDPEIPLDSNSNNNESWSLAKRCISDCQWIQALSTAPLKKLAID